jgi:hypothetical protein
LLLDIVLGIVGALVASEFYHAKATGLPSTCTSRSRRTPNFPNTIAFEELVAPRDDTLTRTSCIGGALVWLRSSRRIPELPASSRRWTLRHRRWSGGLHCRSLSLLHLELPQPRRFGALLTSGWAKFFGFKCISQR